jgi:type IV pilus assembly protein PilB
MAPRRIGQILVDLGFITDEQLDVILQEQEQQPGALFGKVAEDMQLITDEQLIQGLAEQLGMQTVELSEAQLDPKVLARVTETMAQLYRIVPVKFDEANQRLIVATCDPQNLSIQDELRTFLGFDIGMVIATERDVRTAITRYYDSESESVEKLVAELANDEELKRAISLMDNEKFNLTDMEALAESAPVRKLLNMVLLMAIKDQASDIHFEPFEDEFPNQSRGRPL